MGNKSYLFGATAKKFENRNSKSETNQKPEIQIFQTVVDLF